MRKAVAFLAVGFILILAFSPYASYADEWGVDFDASASFGPVKGFVQTPDGGKRSTTDLKRPTLKELGIETGEIFHFGVGVNKGPHNFLTRMHMVGLNGDAKLGDDLTFHNQRYPAGSSVKSDIGLSWYEAGYKYDLGLSDDFVVSPVALFALWDFKAELDHDGRKDSRDYTLWAVRGGLEFEWRLTDKLSLEGSAVLPIPIEKQPEIYSFGAKLKYDFARIGGFHLSAQLGGEYNKIEYKDAQPTPNRISVELGPMITAGIEIRF